MVCAIGYCTLQGWLLLVLKSKEFGGVGDRRGNTCQVPNVRGYHHLGSSKQKFRIQRFRAMFNSAQATCEDSLKQGHIITKTDVMFTIDDAIRQSNQPLFFILTWICRLLRNQRWATRTENLSIQTVVILPSFFFWFFLDNNAPYRAVRMMRGGHHTNKLHRLYIGSWLIPFYRSSSLAKEAGARGKKGDLLPFAWGETLLATYICWRPSPPPLHRPEVYSSRCFSFTFAYSFWSGSPFQYIGHDRISLSSPALVSIRLTYSLSMTDILSPPYCSHLSSLLHRTTSSLDLGGMMC